MPCTRWRSLDRLPRRSERQSTLSSRVAKTLLFGPTWLIFCSIRRSSFMSDNVSRREMLCRCANGFGGLALAYLLADKHASAAVRKPHYAAKAKSVIFLFMDGGVSQIDSFDPKPTLRKMHGQPIPMKTPTTVFNIGNNCLGTPFEFKQYGQSGTPVSELFPNVATCVDDLTIVR